MKTRQVSRSHHTGSNEGWAVVTTLIGGFVVWGGVGWLLDQWLGTRFLTPVGLIVGMGLGIYAVVARLGPAVATGGTSAATPAETDHHDEPPRAGARKETSCP
jgi:F0F1-type ATP synthase assembly protein I